MNITKETSHFLTYCSLLSAAAIICGCASDKAQRQAKPDAAAPERLKAKAACKDRQYAANPSKMKFGEFKSVELKETELALDYRNKGNQKLAKEIDEMLRTGLECAWPVKVIPQGGEFTQSDQRTLQIAPRIEVIKVVSRGARWWLGAMPGGSDLVMHVDYRDSSSGEIIANPDFWKGNNAWLGQWGQMINVDYDSQICVVVVNQIIGYTTGNK